MTGPPVPAPDTEALRRALAAHAQTLRQELRRDEVKRADDIGDPRVVRDRGEQAAQTAQTGVDHAELARDRDELAQVEAALQRLDDGRFGVCRDCGDAIAPARLAAQPWASRCVACQTRAEAQADRAA